MKTELVHYFDYVENVLGVRSVVNFGDSQTTAKKEIALLFVVENLFNFSEIEKDLLNKMIAAVKAPESIYQIADLNQLQQSQNVQAKFVVFFSEEPKNVTGFLFDRHPEVITFSPRILLHNNELKKQAWAEMQKAVHFVKACTT